MIISTCVRLTEKAADISLINPVIEQHSLQANSGKVIVKITAAGVNPSDAKAAIGLMPYAVFPRTPGRDFAGVVIEGPSQWLGRAVFGSSGDLGIRCDGSHASHLVVETEALVELPDTITADEAAGIGVPFVSAVEGFRRAGTPSSGETVLIFGLNGRVGQAAAQLASWWGAHVIGVVRNEKPYQGYASSPIEVINSANTDVAARVRELTDGKGANIVFNTVGDPYFQSAHKSLALAGRQILIAAVDRSVQFNIFEFYRGQHTYVGVDTLALSSVRSGDILRKIVPGLQTRSLRPYPISSNAIYSLREAKDAYRAVMGSASDRIILKPEI
ncbi:MAG: zinc-binding alcohol dehydrogenase family protein [Pseudorhodoplanes sp.]